MTTTNQPLLRYAFLSMNEDDIITKGFEGHIPDYLCIPHMEARGWQVAEGLPEGRVSWRSDPNVFAALDLDLLLVRSPWDYQEDGDGYIAALQHIAAACNASKTGKKMVIENAVDTIAWNVSKKYLMQLRDDGVPIVPSVFHLWPATGEKDATLEDRRMTVKAKIEEAFEKFHPSSTNLEDEVVIKPMISASSDFTYRIKRSDMTDVAASPTTQERAAAFFRHDEHRPPTDKSFLDFLQDVFAGATLDAPTTTFIVQPFLKSVIEQGEMSLFYFDGVLSHAIFKTPKAGDFRVQGEFGGMEKLVYSASAGAAPTAEQIPPAILKIADMSLSAVPAGIPLYGRLDFLQDTSAASSSTKVGIDDNEFNGWRLMEMEVNEPALYFDVDKTSAERFADAVDVRFKKQTQK